MNAQMCKAVIRARRLIRETENEALQKCRVPYLGYYQTGENLFPDRKSLLVLELPFKTDQATLNQAHLEEYEAKCKAKEELLNSKESIREITDKWTKNNSHKKNQDVEITHRKGIIKALETRDILRFDIKLNETSSEAIPLIDFFWVNRPHRVLRHIAELDCGESTKRKLRTGWISLVNFVRSILYPHTGAGVYRPHFSTCGLFKRQRYPVSINALAAILNCLEQRALEDYSVNQASMTDLIAVRMLVYAAMNQHEFTVQEVISACFVKGKVIISTLNSVQEKIQIHVQTPDWFCTLIRAYLGKARRHTILATTSGRKLSRDRINKALSKMEPDAKVTPESILGGLKRMLTGDLHISPDRWCLLPRR